MASNPPPLPNLTSAQRNLTKLVMIVCGGIIALLILAGGVNKDS